MPLWYSEVGQKIVQTMLINSILPYVNLVVAWMIPKIKIKVLDNPDPYKTKKTSIAAFLALWAGGDYVIHFKYSNVLNVVYITMMYGVGLPLLFPLAALNFFNTWVTERIAVAYLMKQPPALDDKLTNNCVRMLRFAPLLFLCNGFWMLSNRQIFQNNWSYIQTSYDKMVS